MIRTGAGRIPRPVKALGVVSFLTDVSSEMIYPLLPVFLTQTLGAGAVALGIIEGVAESTASLLKVVSGVWADRSSRRKPFILFGYGLAGMVRPLIGLAMTWPFVLVCRFVDRVGKGIRTAPRDALIADVTAPAFRGQAYGFHRMMDHAGAVAGPLIAALLLKIFGLPLRAVFLCSIVPALAVILVVVLGVKEPERRTQLQPLERPGLDDFRRAGGGFKLFLFALVLFTLGNSTDAFILLRLSWAGIDAGWIAVIWSAHHVVKSFSAYLGGAACDTWGPRRTLLLGWMAYAAVYAAFAFGRSPAFLIAVFLLYGLYFGLSEPSERAWVAQMAPEHLRGSYMGLYHGAVGLAALPASILFGVLWKFLGVNIAFLTGAGFALAASVVILANRRKPEVSL
ncbi:MAG: MFS transporter [Candidatus Hydrogenedentes bacterium]|nr:MFS transporter [Candidatus Hydrogenedentota bacterium]